MCSSRKKEDDFAPRHTYRSAMDLGNRRSDRWESWGNGQQTASETAQQQSRHRPVTASLSGRPRYFSLGSCTARRGIFLGAGSAQNHRASHPHNAADSLGGCALSDGLLRICPNKNRNRDSGCTCGSSFKPRTDLIHCIPSSVFDWIVSVVSFNCGARHNRLYKWERRWLLASRGPLHKNSVGKVTSGSIPVQLAAQKYARTVRRTPAVPRICSVTTRTIKFEIIGDFLRGQVLCAAIRFLNS